MLFCWKWLWRYIFVPYIIGDHNCLTDFGIKLPNTDWQTVNQPVGWGCRIHRLDFCRRVTLTPNECPGCGTKLHLMVRLQSSSFGKYDIPLPNLLLLGPLWTELVVPIRLSSIGQRELFCHLPYLKPFNCTSNWLKLNKFISIRLQYLKPFNCVQRNEFRLVWK